MRAGASAAAREHPVLIGRETERSRLRALISPPYDASQVLLLLGDAGLGKTVLMAEAAQTGGRAGMRVLATAGRESEQDLAFAGLYQLLRPVLDRAARLPARQAEALLSAFGLAAEPVPPDPLMTGIAVLTLLAALADDEPLLVIVDDVQWLDRASLDALAFAARRLASERVVMLAGVRGSAPPAGFQRDFAQLSLGPLSLPDAGRLLDQLPCPPRGQSREQVLAQADGNPLALIELSRAIAADPSAARRLAAKPLPLSRQLTELMAEQYAALPGATRAALLLVAAADSPDLTAAVIPGFSAQTLAPAEDAGLIRLDLPIPQFGHPLTRSAVYHAASFADQAAAHTQIANALRDQPDRRAWHLAAAALEPDEQVATLLEGSADQARRRGGAAAAARALERAAQLSPSPADRARRLLSACDLAKQAGQADWAREMAGEILTLTSDPDLRLNARLHIGWSLLWSNRSADALDTLVSVAAEAASLGRPAIAWDATAFAGTVVHQTGLSAARAKVRAVLDALSAAGIPDGADVPADEDALWIRSCTDPFEERGEAVDRLRRVAAGPVCDQAKLAGAAWHLDETELAVGVLRELLGRLRAPGVRGASGAALSVMQWACVDSGRWDDALAAADEAADIGAAWKMEAVSGTADLTRATVLALRGELERVGPLLSRVLAVVDGSEYAGFAARAWHAAGLASLAGGDFVAAYAQLSHLFDVDGTPLHYHFSYLGLADLAAAGARAQRRLEARTRIERALARVSPAPGARLEQLVARARGLLAEPAAAEAFFSAPLAEAAGDAWPLERAQLQLDYGEWLRRQRRINEAKPLLLAALETLRNLGATPWARRAETELRATGVPSQLAPDSAGALDELTTQQREIVLLAAQGLTNGEIADRLFLSPRTVASHLYRSYAKLGVTGRHQLRDLTDSPQTNG